MRERIEELVEAIGAVAGEMELQRQEKAPRGHYFRQVRLRRGDKVLTPYMTEYTLETRLEQVAKILGLEV